MKQFIRLIAAKGAGLCRRLAVLFFVPVVACLGLPSVAVYYLVRPESDKSWRASMALEIKCFCEWVRAAWHGFDIELVP